MSIDVEQSSQSDMIRLLGTLDRISMALVALNDTLVRMDTTILFRLKDITEALEHLKKGEA